MDVREGLRGYRFFYRQELGGTGESGPRKTSQGPAQFHLDELCECHSVPPVLIGCHILDFRIVFVRLPHLLPPLVFVILLFFVCLVFCLYVCVAAPVAYASSRPWIATYAIAVATLDP